MSFWNKRERVKKAIFFFAYSGKKANGIEIRGWKSEGKSCNFYEYISSDVPRAMNPWHCFCFVYFEILTPARRLTCVVVFPHHASKDVFMGTQVLSLHGTAGSWPYFLVFYIHATGNVRWMMGMTAAEATPMPYFLVFYIHATGNVRWMMGMTAAEATPIPPPPLFDLVYCT